MTDSGGLRRREATSATFPETQRALSNVFLLNTMMLSSLTIEITNRSMQRLSVGRWHTLTKYTQAFQAL